MVVDLAERQLDESVERAAGNAQGVADRCRPYPGQVEARIVEQALLPGRRTHRDGMALGDEDVGNREVVAAGAAQAEHVPRIQDRGARPPAPRIFASIGAPGRTAHRLVVVPDDARAHQPARMVDAAGEVPTAVDAIAAVDGPRAAPADGSSRQSAYRLGILPSRDRPRARAAPMEFETALAIIVHQPMEPSAREISSTTRKTTSGGSSGPPIERGRYICRRPASASTSTMAAGTWRSVSHSSRAACTCGHEARRCANDIDLHAGDVGRIA